MQDRYSRNRLLALGSASLALLLIAAGCGGIGTFFNPAFINTANGGVVPVTPGPEADFILVRTVNATGQTVEFVVTIEREVLVLDENGSTQQDENGDFVTRKELRTVRLNTGATGNATEMGVLFPCSVTPITRIGLGENLLPTDAAVSVGGQGAGGAGGFGVPAGGLNPLDLYTGNFNCGDTVTFRAFQATGQAGGVGLEVFLLPGSEQPSVFSGPNTFVNFQAYLESLTPETD